MKWHYADFSYGSTFAVFKDGLAYYEVCVRWVPRQVTEEHKQTRLRTSDGSVHRHSQDVEDLVKELSRVTKRGSIIMLYTTEYGVKTPHTFNIVFSGAQPRQLG
jgi:hypothetical protein